MGATKDWQVQKVGLYNQDETPFAFITSTPTPGELAEMAFRVKPAFVVRVDV